MCMPVLTALGLLVPCWIHCIIGLLERCFLQLGGNVGTQLDKSVVQVIMIRDRQTDIQTYRHTDLQAHTHQHKSVSCQNVVLPYSGFDCGQSPYWFVAILYELSLCQLWIQSLYGENDHTDTQTHVPCHSRVEQPQGGTCACLCTYMCMCMQVCMYMCVYLYVMYVMYMGQDWMNHSVSFQQANIRPLVPSLVPNHTYTAPKDTYLPSIWSFDSIRESIF